MNEENETNEIKNDETTETDNNPSPLTISESPVLNKTAQTKAKIWSRDYFLNNLATTTIVLLAITTVGSLVFGVYSYQKLSKEKVKTAELSQSLNDKQKLQNNLNQTENILATVGKLMILPENENPTIATVTDLSKLQNQPFFKNAETGDKVLIYNQSKKAILFRPSTSKIIEYAPLQIEDDTSKEGNVAGTSTNKKKANKK